ncbi:hypothetical protein CQW23_08459 [Capsicum baccatum]|uniref:MATH domain-containing protein n=1 Tax=Capsicum baccatum TaxID=33114 RepID=A0A2G2X955_CAPBA|nr:hypothetical protein CQW23_08459 [Capsicum baccatum]
MIIHPVGDGEGHISLYLAIVGTSSLHADWEVKASFSFLIFDQIHDNYIVMKGMERRFRNIKTEWAYLKCISHETFKDPSKGYLVNDKCIFGVDVYVIKNQGIGECLLSLNGVKPYKHEWKINEFTKLKSYVYSEEFTVEGYKCFTGNSLEIENTSHDNNFLGERSQWIRERGLLREQLEVVSAREQRAREMVDLRDRQAQEWDQAFSSLRGKVHRVAQDTARIGLDYQQLDCDDFLAQVPAFAQRLTASLEDIYLSLGGHIKSKSP